MAGDGMTYDLRLGRYQDVLADVQTGRRAVGSEMDPQTHAKALQRLANAKVTVDWLDAPKATQGGLL